MDTDEETCVGNDERSSIDKVDREKFNMEDNDAQKFAVQAKVFGSKTKAVRQPITIPAWRDQP